MYSLVAFLKERKKDGSTACTIVPSKWISDDKRFCWWPRGKCSYKSAFAKMMEPGPIWEKCSPIKIKLSSDDLTVIRSYEGQFLETSNLESGDESQTKQRSNTKMRHCKTSVAEVDSSNEDSDSLPNAPFVFTLTEGGQGRESRQGVESGVGQEPSNSADVNQFEVLASVSSEAGHNFEIVQQNLENYSAVEKLILQKIEGLSRKIDDLSVHVQSLTPVQQISTDDLQNCPGLPAETLQDLQHVDNFCRESVVNAKKMAILLSRVGGRSVKEATENVLSELMVDIVAAEYNWAGIKRGETPKLAIKSTRLVALIHDALKNMKWHTKVEKTEIQDPIKNWLKNAPARIKRAQKP